MLPNDTRICVACRAHLPRSAFARYTRLTGPKANKPGHYHRSCMQCEAAKAQRAASDGPNPSGLCLCGCGEKTPLARENRLSSGDVKGTPLRYAPGHRPKSRELVCRSCHKAKPRPAFAPCVLKSGARAGEISGLQTICLECKGRFAQERAQKAFRAGPSPSGLCQCGCGEPAPIATYSSRKTGAVKGQPVRYIGRHVPRTFNQKSPLVINPEKFVIDPETGCWIWQRSRNANGYGTLGVDGASRLAHRVYYELTHGPIPDNAPLDHLCRNRGCVNPDHLEPVTPKINTYRGQSVKLSMGKARLIRLQRGRKSARELAAEHGVTEGCIRHVWRGLTWRE